MALMLRDASQRTLGCGSACAHRAAMLLSMRARERRAFWRNEPNRRFSETNPTSPARDVPARGTPRQQKRVYARLWRAMRRGDPVAGTHDHSQWLWVPALAALGRDDDGLVPSDDSTCGCKK